MRSENALLKTENALLKAENVELKAKTAVMEDKKGMKGKPFDRLSSPIKQSFVSPTFAAVDMDLQKKNWNWQKGISDRQRSNKKYQIASVFQRRRNICKD